MLVAAKQDSSSFPQPPPPPPPQPHPPLAPSDDITPSSPIQKQSQQPPRRILMSAHVSRTQTTANAEGISHTRSVPKKPPTNIHIINMNSNQNNEAITNQSIIYNNNTNNILPTHITQQYSQQLQQQQDQLPKPQQQLQQQQQQQDHKANLSKLKQFINTKTSTFMNGTTPIQIEQQAILPSGCLNSNYAVISNLKRSPLKSIPRPTSFAKKPQQQNQQAQQSSSSKRSDSLYVSQGSMVLLAEPNSSSNNNNSNQNNMNNNPSIYVLESNNEEEKMNPSLSSLMEINSWSKQSSQFTNSQQQQQQSLVQQSKQSHQIDQTSQPSQQIQQIPPHLNQRSILISRSIVAASQQSQSQPHQTQQQFQQLSNLQQQQQLMTTQQAQIAQQQLSQQQQQTQKVKTNPGQRVSRQEQSRNSQKRPSSAASNVISNNYRLRGESYEDSSIQQLNSCSPQKVLVYRKRIHPHNLVIKAQTVALSTHLNSQSQQQQYHNQEQKHLHQQQDNEILTGILKRGATFATATASTTATSTAAAATATTSAIVKEKVSEEKEIGQDQINVQEDISREILPIKPIDTAISREKYLQMIENSSLEILIEDSGNQSNEAQQFLVGPIPTASANSHSVLLNGNTDYLTNSTIVVAPTQFSKKSALLSAVHFADSRGYSPVQRKLKQSPTPISRILVTRSDSCNSQAEHQGSAGSQQVHSRWHQAQAVTQKLQSLQPYSNQLQSHLKWSQISTQSNTTSIPSVAVATSTAEKAALTAIPAVSQTGMSLASIQQVRNNKSKKQQREKSEKIGRIIESITQNKYFDPAGDMRTSILLDNQAKREKKLAATAAAAASQPTTISSLKKKTSTSSLSTFDKLYSSTIMSRPSAASSTTTSTTATAVSGNSSAIYSLSASHSQHTLAYNNNSNIEVKETNKTDKQQQQQHSATKSSNAQNTIQIDASSKKKQLNNDYDEADDDEDDEEDELDEDDDEEEALEEDEDDDEKENSFEDEIDYKSLYLNSLTGSKKPIEGATLHQIHMEFASRLVLLKSVYENRPSTVFFPYPLQCGGITRNTSRTVAATDYEETRFDLRYKVTTRSVNRCLSAAFSAAGIRSTESDDWNILWGTGLDSSLVQSMMRYQRLNHFPQCWNLGRKDCLWKNLSKVKRKFPAEYDFIPTTYLLQHRSDWERFLSKRIDAEKGKLWIMKPSNQAQGKNIKMISKRSRVQRNEEYIICEYVANPHLIDGLKYDLRIYVLVTSYDPLRIYIFNDGLTRFATEKYSTSTKELSKQYVHLTNYSLNKNNPLFKQNIDATHDNVGSKWSLQALFKKYEELGIDTQKLNASIHDIIVKTCIAAEPYMTNQYVKCENHRRNCFELYGFDILIDESIKPWLLEVNVRPALSSSSPLDMRIKHTLVCDAFNLVGIHPYDKIKYDEDMKKKIPGVPEGKRAAHSKFIKDLDDLNQENIINKLSPDDWNVLFETDEENYRRGNFKRIFPPDNPVVNGNEDEKKLRDREQFDEYLKYFEYERYNNAIVRAWINSKHNFLEEILIKSSNQNV